MYRGEIKSLRLRWKFFLEMNNSLKTIPRKALRLSNFNPLLRPVSAYALFFRDTQTAIKGQNPNASFGEVSKIVASMWDVLSPEHKNVSKIISNQNRKSTLNFLKQKQTE